MSKTKDLRSVDETVVSEALTRQVATILLTGASVTDCAKQLSMTPAAVRKIAASDRYKELVSETAEQELAPALAKAKAQLARLSTKSVKVLEKAMDVYLENGTGSRDAIQASMVSLKAVGLHEDEKQQQETQIIVNLPSGTEPATFEVPSEPDEV